MGFTFRIGELIATKEDDYIFYDAKEMHMDNAPADGSPTDRTNARWPSYTGWSLFAKSCGLEDIFKRDKPNTLIPNHPGYAVLTTFHKEIIDEAYKKKDTLEKYNAARLEWLKFWVDWALENCKIPAFVNS